MTKTISFIKDQADKLREKFSTMLSGYSELIETFSSIRFSGGGQYIEVKKVLFQPGDKGFRVTLTKIKKTRVWDIFCVQQLARMFEEYIKNINDFDVLLNTYIDVQFN